MKFLNKMERKFGKYAISNIMRYVLILYAVGTAMGIFMPGFYEKFLALDFNMVFKGQIWRLVTFIMDPYSLGSSPLNILFFLIEVYLYYMIGNALENAWGAFRFNLYLISGILFNIIAALICYFSFGVSYSIGLYYIFQSMFLAFAILYPNIEFLVYMIIPIKVKWLGYLYAIILGYEVVVSFLSGTKAGYIQGIAILVAMMNFLIFFIWSKKGKRISPEQMKRKREFKKQVRTMSNMAGEPRHRCAICGRTEQDNPNLEFRFCSKCAGNYEYCSDHLFTHEHVKH